jgi:hypothetical protein
MKQKFHLLLFVATLSLTGCATDHEISEILVEESAAIDSEIIAVIEEMGFSTEDIFITDDSYIVEGDIMIRKDRVEEIINEPKTRHTRYSRVDRRMAECQT